MNIFFNLFGPTEVSRLCLQRSLIPPKKLDNLTCSSSSSCHAKDIKKWKGKKWGYRKEEEWGVAAEMKWIGGGKGNGKVLPSFFAIVSWANIPIYGF